MMIGKIITIAASWICLSYGVDSKERVSLSSLPQLKKWEIPSMPQKYAMRTGRKFKDLDHIYETGSKRSSHWSIKPELNFREIDMEEDSEKIKLDNNYKVFVEDDDLPVLADKKDRIKLKKGVREGLGKNMNFRGKIVKEAEEVGRSSEKLGFPKRLITSVKKSDGTGKIHKKQHPKHVKQDENTNSNRNSKIFQNGQDSDSGRNTENQNLKVDSKSSMALKNKDLSQNDLSMQPSSNGFIQNSKQPALTPMKGAAEKQTFLDSSESLGEHSFSTADLKSHIQSMPPIANQLVARNLEIQQHSLIRSGYANPYITKQSMPNIGNLLKKRAAPPFNEAVRDARAAINAMQNRRQTAPNPHANVMKVVSVGGGKAPRVELQTANKHKQLQEKTLQDSKNQALKLLKNSHLQSKNENSGAIGDEQTSENKIHNNIQSKVTYNNINNRVRAPSLSPVKANVSPVTKPRVNQPTRGASLSQRAKIETPQVNKLKEKLKIVPANVARAVAMAMEQLKRDRMWGKVFVHVLPSGKLKVMVQETKKMPDE